MMNLSEINEIVLRLPVEDRRRLIHNLVDSLTDKLSESQDVSVTTAENPALAMLDEIIASLPDEPNAYAVGDSSDDSVADPNRNTGKTAQKPIVKLMSLRGAGKHVQGQYDPLEYIRQIRDEWDSDL